MNIWDSVHRGLEKASHEAARIAKAQKLRSQIDNLSRQVTTQQGTLLNRTLELFNTNQLTQSQLLPICQELTTLQQQLEQAQNELKQLQSQGIPPSAQTTINSPNATSTYQIPSPYAGGEVAPTIYAPPPPGSDYPPYAEHTIPVPPPPPTNPQTVSALETLLLGETPVPPPPPATTDTLHCQGCQAEVNRGLSFCPNCGRPVQANTSEHLPTVRGGTLEQAYPIGQETMRGEASTGPHTGQNAEGQGAPSGHIADQETRRGEPSPPTVLPNEQDGGA